MDDLIARLRERAQQEGRRTDEEDDVKPEVHPPLSNEAIDAVQDQLGFKLPKPVRRFYSEVCNGGIGPGYGIVGLPGGARADGPDDPVELYKTFRKNDPREPSWRWPEQLLPICDWGSAIRSCIDCSKPDAPVVRFDPNPIDAGDWAKAFNPERPSFELWLRDWLDGNLSFEEHLSAGSGPPPNDSDDVSDVSDEVGGG